MTEKQTEYGALWTKTGPKGEYMTGNLEVNGVKVKVVAFKNTNKKNPNEPDWRILEPKPREEAAKSDTPSIQEQSAYPEEDIKPGDIPF